MKNRFNLLLAIALLAFSALSTAEVTVYANVMYIELRANNPKDLLNKLKIVKSPIMGDAYAWVHSNNQNHTTYTTSDKGCKLHSFDTELDITITLPRWVNVKERSDKHQKWWKLLIEFITVHENSHKKIIIEATEDFQRAAKTIGMQANCDEVKNRYSKLKNKHAMQIRSRDHKLDFKDGGRMRIKDFLFIDALPRPPKIQNEDKVEDKNRH
ncbi:MAG: DUF922 domain-containing protein [Algicola sp.]|nr:DUF922 domain-containing protein [Algicola sp.]